VNRLRIKLLAGTVLILSAANVQADGVALPYVPASVVANSGKVLTPTTAAASGHTVNEASEIVMKSGATEIIPIARGHFNQIHTPFPEPAVIKAEDGSITTEIRNNVIYVGTNSENAVSMIVTPKGQTSPSLNIVMVPKKIPPRQITFKVPDDEMAALSPVFIGSTRAGEWEQSQPYLDTIRDGLRMVATGKVPSGYTMRKATTKDVLPICDHKDGLLKWDFAGGQVVTGRNLAIYVGVVTANEQATGPVVLEEHWCAGTDTAAVAFWPHPVLTPGQSTEVYVVRRTVIPRSTNTVRPSLLGGK